jgi:hypothetical protein
VQKEFATCKKIENSQKLLEINIKLAKENWNMHQNLSTQKNTLTNIPNLQTCVEFEHAKIP